ncbi:MAG: hypothetical protein P8M80_01050 [Pirellulaceae bacterium]|jgi:hypothetical protein|nr:hypothetical protein [Pirellulaceae bacterium]
MVYDVELFQFVTGEIPAIDSIFPTPATYCCTGKTIELIDLA